MSATDSERDDTFDEMEILLDRLLREARETNRYLRFFYVLAIIVLVLYAGGALVTLLVLAGA